MTSKRALWQELKLLVLGTKGNWCLVGDFNAVKSRQERGEGKGSLTEMREFEDFIRDSNLVDLALRGRRYTWYQVNGASMSRIDRFLLSEDWLLNLSDCKEWGLGRSISDHCPIILKNISVDWGPRPFKWFDTWLDTPSLRDEIKKVWNSTKVSRWKRYYLKEKLKAVKRIRKKEICCLHMDGQLVDDVQTLRQKFVEHYTSYFKDEEWRRPTLDGINFNWLSPDSATMLVDNFIEEVVKKTVWDSRVTKEFHENGKLVRGLNESFIVLIPKKEKPLELEDFKPIFLIGAIQLMDGVVVANEVIDEVHRKRKSIFIFKIDFEKAYDKVSWKFLDYMLERMGFDSKWRDNMILFGYATEDNIWVVKCIIRIFELVSGLKINYVKIQLMGVHVVEECLSRAAAILNCKLRVMPFKYLGVPIGDNPRRLKI
ncbi:hypothetical protein SLEP1_g3321 [Rubroshorea leprosula]|uniref:Endonuclease/exonuclease/phosphatase domain-containing protein n=1 Tax=Rubroshorea leprosula TaxID=152421 RepID=A0AAV5HVG6_9ROSI|nr:hypothetical protein SLEP1_g3321 [Rubroshorea leprosula]